MNISPLTIYLWQLADRLTLVASAASFIAGALLILCLLPGGNTEEERRYDRTNTKRIGAFMFSIWLFTSSIWVFLPSSNTIAMMAVIPQIAESKIVQKDLPDLYNAAVEALKSSLKKP